MRRTLGLDFSVPVVALPSFCTLGEVKESLLFSIFICSQLPLPPHLAAKRTGGAGESPSAGPVTSSLALYLRLGEPGGCLKTTLKKSIGFPSFLVAHAVRLTKPTLSLKRRVFSSRLRFALSSLAVRSLGGLLTSLFIAFALVPLVWLTGVLTASELANWDIATFSVFIFIFILFQEYEEPVYSYSTYPGRR